MAPAGDDLKLKLTVTREEHPQLHQVLSAIRQPRRRTQRLKELATAGLMFERGAVPLPAPASGPPLAVADPLDTLGDATSAALWGETAGPR